MTRKPHLYVLLPALFMASAAQADYPLLDMAANQVIEKYQNANCEQLWRMKEEPKTEQQLNMIRFLKEDPQMRTAFIDKIAGPVVNKMFQCGMLP